MACSPNNILPIADALPPQPNGPARAPAQNAGQQVTEFIHDYGPLIIVIGAAADWLRQYQDGDFDDDNDQPAPGKKEKMKQGDNTKKKKEFDGILDTMGVPDDDDVRRDIHEQIKNFPADGKRGTRELLIDIVKEWLENNNKKCP